MQRVLAYDLRLLDFIRSMMESCGGLETHERQMWMGSREIEEERDQTEALVVIQARGGSSLHQAHSHRHGGWVKCSLV